MANIGVLAVQGETEAHHRLLRRLGHRPIRIRSPEQLVDINGLVLPGGESTTQALLLRELGLLEPLKAAIVRGMPTLATCAGLILVAATVDGEEGLLPVLDATVTRNGWGPQRYSFEEECEGHRAIFIRAPRIRAVGADAEVLLKFDGEPIAVRQAAVVGATFHPELAEDPFLHREAFGSPHSKSLT